MASSGSDSLERLQGLHRDLVSLSEEQLPNVDRLVSELQAHINDFRDLLEKKPKNDKSRQKLSSETLEIDGETYSVNDLFRESTIQVADALDLDEIEAAALFLHGQQDADTLDRTALASSIILFHQRRLLTLECLRMTLHEATNGEGDEGAAEQFRNFLMQLLHDNEGKPGSGSIFWHKCIECMFDLEKWQHQISERVQTVSMTDQAQSPEFLDTMTFQHSTLIRQHQALGMITAYFAKGGYTIPDDLNFLITKLKTFDRHDANLIHYLPPLSCSIQQFASSENTCTTEEARSLHQSIIGDTWSLRYFQASVTSIWLTEYSGRFIDQTTGAQNDTESEKGAEKRSDLFMDALKDGALHFMLAVCQGLSTKEWFDPARDGFTMFLIQDSPTLHLESLSADRCFQRLLMEQFQLFADSFITNMPDTLRKLKFDEDEQRRQMQSRVQLRPNEFDLHFERFLILISYAFTEFPDASESFWSDTDSNLYGFLQWASQRQSTPRVAAFCEMLSSISEDQESADAAHRFLLQENVTAAGKLRKNSPLSWSHIFREIEFYSSSIKDRPAIQAGLSGRLGQPQADQFVEPESAMMLECYLRLLSQISRNSETARQWLLTHPTFHLHEHLFLLSGSAIESRLRACAFNTLAALLTDKSRESNELMWTCLDGWISGGMNLGQTASKPPNVQPTKPFNLESILNGFEEPNAFVNLLCALVTPSSDDTAFDGILPFPENLGTAYRMPGIEPFVDFAIGRIFGIKTAELQDSMHLSIIRSACLSFITTCLTDFEEDLIIFANKTSIAVDSAIQTSSLANYARLHPFARVMEWLFNDKVCEALFAATTQDINKVNEASSSSPLILGILQGIETVRLVMSLQPTYFDIIRPMVKLQSTSRKTVVANSALASFEDAILNNLDFISSLALYCGSGHEQLAISSLNLLQQLSSSRKLSAPLVTGVNRRSEKSRLITALERHDQAEVISRPLITEMQFDERDLEQGPGSTGYAIKNAILAFLDACLETVPDRPTVAHSLLGFSTGITTIGVDEGGLISKGSSLLHSIQVFLSNCPWGEEDTIISWLASIKYRALRILQNLWISPMSSSLTLLELRLTDFLFVQSISQIIIRPDTLWDGRQLTDPEFYITESSDACARFLGSRAILLDCAATELRSTKSAGLSSLVARIESTLLGQTKLLDGETINNPSVFDYADFLDLDSTEPLLLPETTLFNVKDLESCRTDLDDADSNYDLKMAEQLISLRLSEATKAGTLPTTDDVQINADIDNILQCLLANNNRNRIQKARSDTLHAWIRLITVMLQECSFTGPQRSTFVLHIMQIILPQFERSLSENLPMSHALAELARSLICQVKFPLSSMDANLARDAVEDRLLELLRMSLYGIQSPDASSELKLACCQICLTYLRGTIFDSKLSSLRRNALQCIRSVGDRLIDTLCDDACNGEGTSRTSSLLLLEAIITVSSLEKSNGVLQAFDNLNFIQVIVDGLRMIPSELRTSSTQAVPLILSYYDASLSLLLRIAQTRLGATFVINAGLLPAIRDSGIFMADPDIGLDVDNPAALSKYFDLLLGCLRILNAILLSKGSDNLQVLELVRKFLEQYRPSMVGILKRSANIGSVDEVNREIVAELADYITLLVTASGFMESDGNQSPSLGSPRLFT